MMGAATQALRKHFDPIIPSSQGKTFHFLQLSGSWILLQRTWMALQQKLYTDELVTKTSNKGDCCMLSVVEWGHSRLMCQEYPEDYEDEDHMNYVGEFYFKVNETCLHGDHNIFMVAPNDRDAHNPILVHLGSF